MLPALRAPDPVRPLRPTLAAALLLAPALAGAHDLWLERDGGALALRRGHRHGALVALDPARVRSLRCRDQGVTRDLRAAATAHPKELRLAARCEAASAAFDNGAWSLTPDGEVNRPRTEVPQAVRSWLQRQYAKWAEPRAAGAVFGDELELVAEGDLAAAPPGGAVALRVLSAGAPVPGASVSIGHDEVATSDAAGRVRVRLPGPGAQTVTARVRRRLGAPEADVLLLQASLTVEVAR